MPPNDANMSSNYVDPVNSVDLEKDIKISKANQSMDIQYDKKLELFKLRSMTKNECLSPTMIEELKRRNWSYGTDGHGGFNAMVITTNGEDDKDELERLLAITH